MWRLKLKYQLTKEEIEETLLCLEWKREGIFKSINLGIISILGAIVLIAYIRDPAQFFWFLMLVMIILLLFYMWYGPRRRRRKTAERMVKQGGSYEIVIGDDHIELAGSSKKTGLKDKKLKLYVSENMYVLKVDGDICAIPKRILGREQKEKLVRLVSRYQADTVNIVIEKE